MFGRTWKTSKRKYDVLIERDVKIPVRDGTILNADVIRPKSEDKFPAILGYFPYNLEMQSAPIHTDSFSSVVFKHPNQEKANASIEAGDLIFMLDGATSMSWSISEEQENLGGNTHLSDPRSCRMDMMWLNGLQFSPGVMDRMEGYSRLIGTKIAISKL